MDKIYIEDKRGIEDLDNFLLDCPTISQDEREEIMEILEAKPQVLSLQETLKAKGQAQKEEIKLHLLDILEECKGRIEMGQIEQDVLDIAEQLNIELEKVIV